MKWARLLRKEIGVCVLIAFALLLRVESQSPASSERTFPQSKVALEQALKNLQPSLSGRLPMLDGFVSPGDQPLDRYRRPYFQTSVQVSAAQPGNSVVRVSTKITAWYADPSGAHSGYRALPSNGRLEADLLDQLSEELAKASAAPAPAPAAAGVATQPTEQPPGTGKPAAPAAAGPFSPPLSPTFPPREQVANTAKGTDGDLQAEIKSLEEILHNQAHPSNLVAVKQSGTAVVASPSLTAKTIFLASAHDEFEMLDFNADWVHVRISGLSRGWIWRNSLEMPEGIPDTLARPGAGANAAAAQPFHVTREETAPFPGDWQPLRGKSVRILSVEKNDQSASDSGVTMRLEFAKSVLDKSYNELAQKADTLAGIVLIFDSADGGMIAATLPVMKQWKAGALSDSAFWRQCFFDPPEMLGGAGGSASQ